MREVRKEKTKKKIKCSECMYDAPYNFCCKTECGEHEFCNGCTSECRFDKCPNE